VCCRCVAVCCSVLQRVAGVLHCVAGVLQCVAVRDAVRDTVCMAGCTRLNEVIHV